MNAKIEKGLKRLRNPYFWKIAVIAVVSILKVLGDRYIPATWKALVWLVILTLVILWLLEPYM